MEEGVWKKKKKDPDDGYKAKWVVGLWEAVVIGNARRSNHLNALHLTPFPIEIHYSFGEKE